jgi:hypothetical protein
MGRRLRRLFIEPGDSMIEFAAAAHGVLSQDSLPHPQHLAAADPSAFDQTDRHAHILDDAGVRSGRVVLGRGELWASLSSSTSRRATRFALAVEYALLFLVIRITVVVDAPLGGPLPAMGLTTAEGATQVFPTGIARMGEKKDSAMPAPSQALSQKGLGSQNRSEDQIVSEN